MLSTLPALAGIRVMLRPRPNPKVTQKLPALAGIHVMLPTLTAAQLLF